MTVQPDFPAFASLEALLISMAKRTRDFVLGRTGMAMGEETAAMSLRGQPSAVQLGRESKAFVPSLLAEPRGSNHNPTSKTGAFGCSLRSNSTRWNSGDRQAKVWAGPSLPSASLYLHFILVLKNLLISIHFQYVVHTGSLNHVTQCSELRNFLLIIVEVFSSL